MNEENLSISIRARILPVLEGSDQLVQQVQQLPQSINSRMRETVQSPAFQEGLTSPQLKKIQNLTNFQDSYEFQQIQDREKALIDDYKLATESGKLTRAQSTSYNKKFKKLGTDYAAFGTEFIPSQLDEEYYKDIDPAHKEILRASARQGAAEATGKIPDITEKLNQINFAQDYMRKVGSTESEHYQRQKELEYDVESGSFTKKRGERYLSKDRESIQSLEEMQKEAREKFAGTPFGDRIFKTIGDDIEAAKIKMRDFGEEIEKAGKGGGNLLQSLRTAGILALAGVAIDAGLRYETKTEQVAARERTSFDFSSPLSMYNARQQNELFKYTTERTRDYELGGGLIGMGAGAVLGGAMLGLQTGTVGGPWGMVGGAVIGGISGYMTGSSLGEKGAELGDNGNIKKRMEVEEELKFFNESSGTLGGYVGQSRGYDIERAKIRARLGGAAFTSNVDEGLGYSPDEKLKMRNTFSDQYGKWDEKLYGEQTAFAREKGIDPNAIYGLNVTARMTGMDVSTSGLEKARQIATNTYGENVSSQRIVDVLNALKDINEKMLSVNMNMDSRSATQAGLLPSMIFGKDNVYGQLGNKGLQGLNAIERLGAGGSNAEDAWLYRAYSEKDLNKFYERKREGISNLENFSDQIRQLNRDAKGDEWLIERRLNTMPQFSDFKTAGIIPKIAEFAAEHPNGVTKADYDEFSKKHPEFKPKTKEEIIEAAKNAVPESLTREEKIAKTINEAADKWRTTVYDMSTASAEFWNRMGSSAEYHELFIKKMTGTIGDMDLIAQRIMKDLGIAPPPKGADRLEGSDIYKTRFGEIKNKHDEVATGWVKKNSERLREFIAENTRGEYLVNLYEGYDPTGKGHAPNSPHYKNSDKEGAMDIEAFRMNEKGKMIKIPKYDIPKDPALNTLFDEYAKENNIRWGGHFKRSWEDGKYINKPDPNHFDYLPYNSNDNDVNPEVKLEQHKKFEVPAKERAAKETPKPADIKRADDLGIKIKTEPAPILPEVKLEQHKKFEVPAKERADQQSKMYGQIKDLNIGGKGKEYSFFEPNDKSKIAGKDVLQPQIDYNRIERAFANALNNHQGNIVLKEIIIRDRTASGITTEHMENAHNNANSIFGGGH